MKILFKIFCISVAFLGVSQIGLGIQEVDQNLFMIPPAIQEEILKISGADSIQSVDTIVYKKIGMDSILVIECGLNIATVKSKIIPEDVMYSSFIFISRNGSKLLHEKLEIVPRKILENDFKLPPVEK